MKSTTYRTLVEALTELRSKGFIEDFKFTGGKLECLRTHKAYGYNELTISEIHRFEGDSNPSDMSVVFALKGSDGLKGTVVSSYGAVADIELLEFMDKVKILDRTSVSGH